MSTRPTSSTKTPTRIAAKTAKVAPNIATVKPMKIADSTATCSTQNIYTIVHSTSNLGAAQPVTMYTSAGGKTTTLPKSNIYQLALVTIDGVKKQLLIPIQRKDQTGNSLPPGQKNDGGNTLLPATVNAQTINAPVNVGCPVQKSTQMQLSNPCPPPVSLLHGTTQTVGAFSGTTPPACLNQLQAQEAVARAGSRKFVIVPPTPIVIGSPPPAPAVQQPMASLLASSQLHNISRQLQITNNPTAPTVQTLVGSLSTVEPAKVATTLSPTFQVLNTNIATVPSMTVTQPLTVPVINNNVTAQPVASSLINMLRSQTLMPSVPNTRNTQPVIINPISNRTDSQATTSSILKIPSAAKLRNIAPNVTAQQSSSSNSPPVCHNTLTTDPATERSKSILKPKSRTQNHTLNASQNVSRHQNNKCLMRNDSSGQQSNPGNGQQKTSNTGNGQQKTSNTGNGQQISSSTGNGQQKTKKKKKGSGQQKTINGQNYVVAVQHAQSTDIPVSSTYGQSQRPSSNLLDITETKTDEAEPLFQIQEVYSLSSGDINTEQVINSFKTDKRRERLKYDRSGDYDSGRTIEGEDKTEENASVEAEASFLGQASVMETPQQHEGRIKELQFSSEEYDTCTLNLDCENIVDTDSEEGDNEGTGSDGSDSESEAMEKTEESVFNENHDTHGNIEEMLDSTRTPSVLEKLGNEKKQPGAQFNPTDEEKVKNCTVVLKRVKIPKDQSVWKNSDVDHVLKPRQVDMCPTELGIRQSESKDLSLGQSEDEGKKRKNSSPVNRITKVFVVSNKHTLPQTTSSTPDTSTVAYTKSTFTKAMNPGTSTVANTGSTYLKIMNSETSSNGNAITTVVQTMEAPHLFPPSKSTPPAKKEYQKYLCVKVNGRDVILPLAARSLIKSSDDSSEKRVYYSNAFYKQEGDKKVGELNTESLKMDKKVLFAQSGKSILLSKILPETDRPAEGRVDKLETSRGTPACKTDATPPTLSPTHPKMSQTNAQPSSSPLMKVKREPVTYGYGDEASGTASSSSHAITTPGEPAKHVDLALKAVKTEPKYSYEPPSKVPKVEYGCGTTIQEFQNERIRKLKEKLRQQNEAVEQLRRKMKTEPN